jgi:hypothetical protein
MGNGLSRGRRLRTCLWLFATASALVLTSVGAHAFDIAPGVNDFESVGLFQRILRAISRAEGNVVEVYIRNAQVGVHEEITREAYRELGKVASTDVQQGAEWNDNPPFVLVGRQINMAPTCGGLPIKIPSAWPGCWLMVIGTASAEAAPPGDHVVFGPEDPILSRSHFGDMQFLHAMAPDGEPASVTREKIMDWARFAYNIANGTLDLDTIVASRQADPGDQFFPVTSQQFRGETVRHLFAGEEDHPPGDRVRDLAFGSLLHVIQDSFSKAHVSREDPNAPHGHWPGRVCEFHGYAHQNHSEHAKSDHEEQFKKPDTRPYVVEAVRQIVAKRERHAPWREVEPLLRVIFDVADNSRPAGPGEYIVKVHGMIGPRGEEYFGSPINEQLAPEPNPADCGAKTSPVATGPARRVNGGIE